jgi:hypothetical protein
MKWMLLLLFAITVPLFAIELTPPAKIGDPRGYVALRALTAPKMDGKLDDDAWKQAPWSEDFVDIEGDAKPKPRHRTRMKMLWDDKYLYIAAELTEPHLWGVIDKHDEVIFYDPDFEVFLDPDGDSHNYAELELNSKNTTWDLLLTKPYKDGGSALNGWEIVGLKTAVHLNGTLNNSSDTDIGWTVEIAWPWASLKDIMELQPAQDGQRYRINFSRVEWDFDIVDGKYVKVKGRPEHNWVWSPQGVIDMHRPERWGTVELQTNPKAYTPDPNQAMLDRLHDVYYAQKNYIEKHGRYAAKLEDLKLANNMLSLQATDRYFDVSETHNGERWTLTSDGRVAKPKKK